MGAGLGASLALNWLVGLHVVLAGLTAAWCAGRLGASKEGQLLAGLAYGLGTPTVARISAGHLAFLESNAWLPLATGFAAQAWRPRAAAYLGIAVALTIIGGQPEMVIFALWWYPLWAGLGAIVQRRSAISTALVQAVVPGYNLFRVPSKHLVLAALALALAAGLGIERLRGRRVGVLALGIATHLYLAAFGADRWLPALAALTGQTPGWISRRIVGPSPSWPEWPSRAAPSPWYSSPWPPSSPGAGRRARCSP